MTDTTTGELDIPGPTNVPDEWDFYMCRADDAPMSVFLNLWYRKRTPPPAASTCYWLDVEMLEPGPQGLGVSSEADRLNHAEDQIACAIAQHGFYHVGRTRSRGSWKPVFYGPASMTTTLGSIARGFLEPPAKCEVVAKADPTWSHYLENLCPNEERWQWMQNRHVTDSLQSNGDNPVVPRRIDHWAYFPTAGERDTFVRYVTGVGFATESAPVTNEGERPFGAQVYRVDSAQLEEIHEVVMLLKRVAEESRGDYDGWETFVVRTVD